MNYNIFPVIVSFIFIVFLYIFVSKKEGGCVNILLPNLIVFIPTHYIFVMFASISMSINHEFWIYTYIYLAYFLKLALFYFGYLLFKGSDKQCFTYKYSPLKYGGLSLLFFTFAFFIYLPVLIQFKEFLLAPRYIYEQTRTGFGLNFFLSLTCSFVSIIFSFYINKKGIKALLILLNLVLLLLHGSKSSILFVIMMYLLFQVYVKRINVKIKYLMIVLIIFFIFLYLFFMYTFLGDASVIAKMMSYSDYTKNTMLVIKGSYPIQYGRLLLESEFYSRIPRIIFPEKPINFGYTRLVEFYYPDRFFDNKGLPAFDYGEYWADFGFLSIFVSSATSFIKGILLGVCHKILINKPEPYIFMVFVFLSGIGLIPTGAGWLLYEHIAIAIIIYLMMNLRVKYDYKFVPNR